MKKIVIGFILGIILCVSVNAAVSLSSDKISYNNTTVKDSLDDLFDNSLDGKTKIAEAITNKGIKTLNTDSYDVMVENINNISTGNPNLRYDEESGYIQAINTEGIWENLYASDSLPLSDKLYIYHKGTVYRELTTSGYQYLSDWGNPTGVLTYYDDYIYMQNTSMQFGLGTLSVLDFTDFPYVIVKFTDGTTIKISTGQPSSAFFCICMTKNDNSYGWRIGVVNRKNSLWNATWYGYQAISAQSYNISSIYLSKK